jgi:hypothetical protein
VQIIVIEIKAPKNENDQNGTRLELQIYVLRNRLRKAKRAYERMIAAPGKNPTFEIAWALGKEGPSKYDTPARRASLEFVVIMSDFILPSKFLNLEAIFSMMGEIPSAELQSCVLQAQTKLATLERAPPIIAKANIPITARDIFTDICQNVIFTDDTAAYPFVERLNSSPQAGAVWKHFHEYCRVAYETLLGLVA